MNTLNQPKETFSCTENLTSDIIPASFNLVLRKLFEPAGYAVEDVEPEIESIEYGALKFTLNGQRIIYRQAKTTPKKIGQFVTIWKREHPNSEIAPIDLKDGVDWVIIAANEGTNFGVFVFSAQLLAKKGVFSEESKVGKRAMRVYAPWTNPTAAQAKRTKNWQTKCFFDFESSDADLKSFTKKLG
ncbi:MepB family protein [Psychrobacter alimentarius]|uniref:MepB family protein n=1 Tax=Psychrobacter alimentarius TaxID=261164 RepID=UPI00191ACEF5|nr:MepB family protein [Psychrobacter alimentarius]